MTIFSPLFLQYWCVEWFCRFLMTFLFCHQGEGSLEALEIQFINSFVLNNKHQYCSCRHYIVYIYVSINLFCFIPEFYILFQILRQQWGLWHSDIWRWLCVQIKYKKEVLKGKGVGREGEEKEGGGNLNKKRRWNQTVLRRPNSRENKLFYQLLIQLRVCSNRAF